MVRMRIASAAIVSSTDEGLLERLSLDQWGLVDLVRLELLVRASSLSSVHPVSPRSTSRSSPFVVDLLGWLAEFAIAKWSYIARKRHLPSKAVSNTSISTAAWLPVRGGGR